MDRFNYLDIDRTENEPLLDEKKVKNNFNGFKGALRFATYIEDAHDKDSYTDYIETVSKKDFKQMQQYYVDDFLLRPYSPIFKETIGDITNCNFSKCIRLQDILEGIVYNDIENFFEFMKKDTVLKSHYKRLLG